MRILEHFLVPHVKSSALHKTLFHACSHISEPDCGVKQALAEGRIARERYDNYVQIYEELKEKEKNKY